MTCGLLGRKLGHSYSPQIHSRLATYDYVLFEKEPEALEEFLRTGPFSGLNVTTPYKKDVIPYLDELTPTAARLGAVNTIVRRNGRLIGHNTDYFGFLTMVRTSGLDVTGKKVLVLGSGGASNTAVAVLEELGAHVVIISRSGENNYGNLCRHADTAMIVNTTPVGMFPNTERSPVDLKLFPKLEGVLDVIYNPARTMLLRQAEALDLPAVNGLLMLVAQAKEAAEWFSGHSLDDSLILTIHRELRQQVENIILIGMPGCGKSTIGREIARCLGKQFVDADDTIEKVAKCSIAEIFAKHGELGFRELETTVLGELGKQSGLVIATGGGCVTRHENYSLLHQNGKLFWIQRDLAELPTDGRPLSQSGKLEEMYRIRKPLYESFADHSSENDGSIEAAVAEIIRIWEECA